MGWLDPILEWINPNLRPAREAADREKRLLEMELQFLGERIDREIALQEEMNKHREVDAAFFGWARQRAMDRWAAEEALKRRLDET